ncbi:hypothetical protein [Lysobacter hankyongensis]|uniref:hypothetical protein n=1 Tax=Lysobacter hankyongensis TaxID=1176535 RepID=UPI0031F10CD4
MAMPRETRSTKRQRIDSNAETNRARQSKRRKMPMKQRENAGFPLRADEFRPNLPQRVTGWRDRHRGTPLIRASGIAEPADRSRKRREHGRDDRSASQ